MIKLLRALKENKKNKYYSYLKILSNYIETFSVKYSVLNIKNILSMKKSDTIFILGSGPSLNNLSLEEIEEINTGGVKAVKERCIAVLTRNQTYMC